MAGGGMALQLPLSLWTLWHNTPVKRQQVGRWEVQIPSLLSMLPSQNPKSMPLSLQMPERSPH